jgi:hypothetical protein
MSWALAGVLVVVGIVIVRRMAKNYAAFLREEFGKKVHQAATSCTPLAHSLHWEETSVLFQIASALRPEGRVLPGQRPIDVRLSGFALATLDSLMHQLAGGSPGIASKHAEFRVQEIRSAASVTIHIIQIQRVFLSGGLLPADDFTLGYLFGFSVGIARGRGLDAAQEIVTAAFVLGAFYPADAAIGHVSTSWFAQGNRPRLTASQFGMHEAIEFLRSRQPPTGLMSRPPESDLARFDSGTAGTPPPASGLQRPDSHVDDATQACLTIVAGQIGGISKKRLSAAYVRGYLAGVADGIAQCYSLTDEEAIVTGSILFSRHYGPTRGPKLLKDALEAGEHTIVFSGREDGGQDALDYFHHRTQPRRLAGHLGSD